MQYQLQGLIILVFLVSSKTSQLFYCIFQNSDNSSYQSNSVADSGRRVNHIKCLISFIQNVFFKFWLWGWGQQPLPPSPALGVPLIPDDVYLLLRRVKVIDGHSE